MINTLLCMSRNLIYEKLQKVEKKKNTHRKCEITKRHKAAQELQKNSTCTLQSWGIFTWRMESQTRM